MTKNKFDKECIIFNLKKEILESHIEKLKCLLNLDTEMLFKYITNLVNSINFHYNCGIALVKNGVTKE